MVRTGKQIDAAFVELLHRRAYGDIRVSDITRKAHVGRATFYAHYASKDELLRSQFGRIVAPMLAIRNGRCPLEATAFFLHVQTSPRIYKALVASPTAGNAPRIIRECFEDRVAEALATACFADTQQPMIKRFVASSLFAVTECWVERGAVESPHEIQELFSRLVGEGLGGAGR